MTVVSRSSTKASCSFASEATRNLMPSGVTRSAIIDGVIPGRSTVPFGITIIIGLAFFAAMRLSRMKPARPSELQHESSSPPPLIKYSTGYFAWLVFLVGRRVDVHPAHLAERGRLIPNLPDLAVRHW